jgi:hypothetical protein
VDAASESYRALVGRVRETLDAFAIARFDVDHAAMAIWALGHGLASFVLNERISPEVAAVVGDGRVLVRHVAAILAAGFASGMALDRRDGENDRATRRTSHAAAEDGAPR